jgi:hypothetical protein
VCHWLWWPSSTCLLLYLHTFFYLLSLIRVFESRYPIITSSTTIGRKTLIISINIKSKSVLCLASKTCDELSCMHCFNLAQLPSPARALPTRLHPREFFPPQQPAK